MELGECTQLWNYLYIDDAVNAIVKLLTGDAPAGVYNVAGEDTRPLREYIETMRALCGGQGTCPVWQAAAKRRRRDIARS